MSIYSVYVETAHGNVRVYEVAALSLDAAMREASQYGRVEYAVRTRGIAQVQ